MSYLNLVVSLDQSEQDHVSGLLGSNDANRADDFTTSGGQVLPDPPTIQQLYGDFGNSWRISQAQSLFTYQNGQSTATFADSAFPCAFVTAGSLPPDTISSATGTCNTVGIVSEPFLGACILDVGVTGNQNFAVGDAAMQTFESTSWSGGGGSPPTATNSQPSLTPTPTTTPTATALATVTARPSPTTTATLTPTPGRRTRRLQHRCRPHLLPAHPTRPQPPAQGRPRIP
ncbi:MAG: VWD domain-containing protein [Chloroflexi bacterium]|nr:VWD domain-containing protein [Chloroflexota bacterium]MBV9598486.1 VWD domain-containing protein [Chloroflexota bacterium]